MAVKLTFHGACGTVTGSCFELRTKRSTVLIDCGMFQGTKSIKALNYGRFPFAPGSVDSVVLTHAHIDHSGLIPKLIATGFGGPVLATPGTADLLTYMLPDSGHIQETEVDRLNRRNRQRGLPTVEPIYTRAIAQSALDRVQARDYGHWVDAAPGLRTRFWDAGHILGSASVEVEVREADRGRPLRLLFSGDIGGGDKDFHGAPQGPDGLDFVVMESTYGGTVRRQQTADNRRRMLARELKAAFAAGGLVLIPAFAVERTQELLFDLDALIDAGTIPAVPVFVDSPLAQRATEVFDKHLDFGAGGTHPFRRGNVRFVSTQDESKRLNRLRGGAIVMAGSGMCDAGRIRHHLKAHLGRADTTVLLVGYQTPGTLGRLLLDGESMVRIHGEEVKVAGRIRFLDEYSGHADQSGLLRWLDARGTVAWDVFLVHGEDNARDGLAQALIDGGIPRTRIRRPAHGETVSLSAAAGAKTIGVTADVDVAANTASDWHNAYSSTILDLRQTLEKLPSDRARNKLLTRMRGTLGRRYKRGHYIRGHHT
jgi:metallo-beta-lactamase family protein